MFEKIKNNKVLKLIYNIAYTILVIITLLILVAVILQRVSNNTLALGGFRIFNVATGSMIPKYQVGDILISKTINPSDVKVEDDIVYAGMKGDFAGKIITHQVIQIDKNEGNLVFHTKGIANDTEDPTIEGNQILGKVLYRTVILSYISKLINNLYSFYFVVFIPIALLLFIEIRKTIISLREAKEEDEEIEEVEEDRKIENDNENKDIKETIEEKPGDENEKDK